MLSLLGLKATDRVTDNVNMQVMLSTSAISGLSGRFCTIIAFATRYQRGFRVQVADGALLAIVNKHHDEKLNILHSVIFVMRLVIRVHIILK